MIAAKEMGQNLYRSRAKSLVATESANVRIETLLATVSEDFKAAGYASESPQNALIKDKIWAVNRISSGLQPLHASS